MSDLLKEQMAEAAMEWVYQCRDFCGSRAMDAQAEVFRLAETMVDGREASKRCAFCDLVPSTGFRTCGVHRVYEGVG